MKEFTLYWKHGKKDVVSGDSIADAMNNAGIGNGALRALDFYAENTETKYEKYVWNDQTKDWDMTEEYKKRTFRR